MMTELNERRARSQVFFKYLPGSVFYANRFWRKVDELDLREFTQSREYLVNEVLQFKNNWSANSQLSVDVYPDRSDSFFFGEVTRVTYSLFPLVFYCNKCSNTHSYRTLNEIRVSNPKLNCQYCKQGRLQQYPYALIHQNGDIQPLRVKLLSGSDWSSQHNGLKMNDTRRFTTATWVDYKRRISLGSLGTRATTLPRVPGSKAFLSGTNLGDGDVHYPVIKSFVNLQNDILEKRKQQDEFPQIQLAALLQLESLDIEHFSRNFEKGTEKDVLSDIMKLAKDSDREVLLRLLGEKGIKLDADSNGIEDEVNALFGGNAPRERVMSDRSLHEFVFTWYENNGLSLASSMHEAQQEHDAVREAQVARAQTEAQNLGVSSLMLVEKLPVLTLGLGFTRKTYDREEAILNPFRQRIDGKERVVIPVLKNENEAIVFKLDPQRILAWLHVNGTTNPPILTASTQQGAHAYLYERFVYSSVPDDEISRIVLRDCIGSENYLISVMSFRLLHTILHLLLQAGKSVLGLDIDSISEYLFPSALSGAIYVSKLQGGGMGALVSAFESDLSRWLRNAYDKSQSCLYDPVCHEHGGACHACQYVKFSCRYFNHGLSRNLLTGGIIPDYDKYHTFIGYYSSKVDEVISQWTNKL
ncbi:hypothetical protein AYW79_11945 [Ferroacidibacillus organovorans]|uniref:DUF1998 domain-containing protein n=2 Tax=Ferroacidibacillus organovorans TaxID=1765683 RepID=A0A853K9Z9_9BACL|nr:hypothetical protein AYJ22_12270 [Ferroacidibacillus organovorans]OAG93173.1 hypothetical protein AYW79_11945 [Ferroacidibacillus organovorans]